MAEVFSGTPAIVTVAVSDQEGKKVEYHVCGREMDSVKMAVFNALEALPDEDEQKPKAKRTRRTKAQLTASRAIEEATEAKEPFAAGAVKRTWAD